MHELPSYSKCFVFHVTLLEYIHYLSLFAILRLLICRNAILYFKLSERIKGREAIDLFIDS